MASKVIPFACIIVVVLLSFEAADAVIGINWGRQTAQKLIPSNVVDLLLQNKVPEARIYSSDKDILEAFAGSGINLTITIYQISQINNYTAANKWIKDKIPYFLASNIRRIYLGNHVFNVGLKNKSFINFAISTLEAMQDALNDAGYGDRIKVTFPHPELVLKNVSKPSEAEFLDEIKEEMNRTLSIHQANGAPFVIEFFPISTVTERGLDPSFAFPDNKSTYVVRDVNGAVYRNVFEFLHDCFVWALKKAGYPDMELIVGHVGWPTDGYPGANASTAERFYKSLLPFVASNTGTPMRPGAPIHTYVHCLTDENMMPFNYPFSRHWGIYRSNGEPKYKIDLTGQGRDIFPTRARGIMRMPERWCVFNGNMTDTFAVRDQFNSACLEADCTSLEPGGSCSQLSFSQNVSYSFNMYFQARFQNESACEFAGFGRVVTENPSVGGCVFPVEVVEGENEAGAGNRLHETSKWANYFVFLLWMYWALFYE